MLTIKDRCSKVPAPGSILFSNRDGQEMCIKSQKYYLAFSSQVRRVRTTHPSSMKIFQLSKGSPGVDTQKKKTRVILDTSSQPSYPWRRGAPAEASSMFPEMNSYFQELNVYGPRESFHYLANMNIRIQ